MGEGIALAERTRRIPVGRPGTPADVAVVFLASDEASWLTGRTSALDGGATAH